MIKLPDDTAFKSFNFQTGWPLCGVSNSSAAKAGWDAAIAEVQRLNATAQPVSDGWVKCSDHLPHNKPGLWSEPVAAMSDLGVIFTLSCMDGYWQRTSDFINSGASEVVRWMPIPKFED